MRRDELFPGDIVIVQGTRDFWGDEPDEVGLIVAFDPLAMYPSEMRATILMSTSGKLQWCHPHMLQRLTAHEDRLDPTS